MGMKMSLTRTWHMQMMMALFDEFASLLSPDFPDFFLLFSQQKPLAAGRGRGAKELI